MVYVAELDENGYIKAVSELNEMPVGDRFVKLASLDLSLLRTKYNGKWVGTAEPPPKSDKPAWLRRQLDRVKR